MLLLVRGWLVGRMHYLAAFGCLRNCSCKKSDYISIVVLDLVGKQRVMESMPRTSTVSFFSFDRHGDGFAGRGWGGGGSLTNTRCKAKQIQFEKQKVMLDRSIGLMVINVINS